jgi:ATP-dependent DNA helicase RecQ
LNISPEGLQALKQKVQIFLSKPQIRLPRKPESRADSRTSSRHLEAGQQPFEPISDELFEKLRAVRREIARERNVPAFIVLGDAALKDMAKKRPKNLKDLLGVFGIGENKQQQFGEAFLQVIRDYEGEKGREAGF